jgi:hypothetical protein
MAVKQAKNRGGSASTVARGDGTGREGNAPPVENRWQPGQSGNPNGRPKGAETSFERVLRQELERLVDGDSSLGDNGRICRRRRLVRALLDAVERGAPWALRLAFERIWPAGSSASAPIIELHIDEQDLNA